MTEQLAWRPLYLDVDPDPVFAIFHPASKSSSSTAVLLLPPWGWDEVTSYRSRRAWAEHLAAAGHPTLRLDFPGSGDSGGGPGDPRRIEVWVASIRAAVTWLRDSTGSGRVAVVGLGLGGLVAGRAVSEGVPIDDMVLWAVPPTGRAFLRGERAFSKFQDTRFSMTGELEPMLLPEGWMEVGGFVLSAETIEAIESISLRTMEAGSLRRALLLERDGISVDEPLRRHLADAGVVVTVAPGNGWGAMGMFVDRYDPPLDVFAAVASWLDQAPSAAGGVSARVFERDVAELRVGDGRVRESPLTLPRSFGRLFGVLVEPMDVPRSGICAVFLNAGGVRRTGPNRIWVDVSRRWALRGIPALRIDLEGVGDSDGDPSSYVGVGRYYQPHLLEQLGGFLDEFRGRQPGARFVLVGLCSGGYWTFQAALHQARIAAAVAVNAGALVWDDDLVMRRDARKLHRLLEPAWWRRIVRGEIRVTRMREVALAVAGRARLPRRHAAEEVRGQPALPASSLDSALDKLREAGTRFVLAFSADEALEIELGEAGILERMRSMPNVSLVKLPGRDHTVRPIVAQRAVHDLLDAEFAAVLDKPPRVMQG